jgi:hypothetical protein
MGVDQDAVPSMSPSWRIADAGNWYITEGGREISRTVRRRSVLPKHFEHGGHGADEDQRADDRADSYGTNVAESFHRSHCLGVGHTRRRASATKYFTTQLREQNAAGIKGATSNDCCALPRIRRNLVSTMVSMKSDYKLRDVRREAQAHI